MSGVAENIYGGAADFGKLWAVISAVFLTLISILMVIGGIYIIYHRAHLKIVTGLVTRGNYNCVTNTDNNGNKTNTCNVDVRYIVNGKLYNKTYNTSVNYNLNDKVDVYYDPSAPQDSEINPVPKVIGWGLIVGGVVITVLAWVWVWLTRKYKFLAAAQGVRGAYDILK